MKVLWTVSGLSLPAAVWQLVEVPRLLSEPVGLLLLGAAYMLIARRILRAR